MKCLWLPRMQQLPYKNQNIGEKYSTLRNRKYHTGFWAFLICIVLKKHRLKTKNMVEYCCFVLRSKTLHCQTERKNQLRKCSTGTRRVYAMKLETIQWHSFSMTWFCEALKIKRGGGEGWMVLWCKISNPSCGKQFSKIGGR